MADESLNTRVRNDLLKSGFAAELKAADAFRAAGWVTICGPTFFDRSIGQSREIDVQGYRWDLFTDNLGNSMETMIEIWVEVKKSEAPWVVLRGSAPDPDDNPPLRSNYRSNVICEGVPGSEWDYYELVARRSIAFENGWLGYGVHEAFKKPQVASRWFVAGSKLARVARHSCEKYGVASPEPSHAFLGVVQQLIILEGQLHDATIANGELQIGEICSAAVQFSLAEGDRDQRSMIIDVVTMAQLEHYLVRQNELFESLKNRLMVAAEHT